MKNIMSSFRNMGLRFLKAKAELILILIITKLKHGVIKYEQIDENKEFYTVALAR